MQITIDVPEAICSRCKKTAPVSPQTLRRCENSSVSTALTSVDSAGGRWQAVNAELPAGWIAVDGKKTQLCEECAETWKDMTKGFIENKAPPAPPPAANIAPTPKIEFEAPQAAPIPVAAPAPWAVSSPIPARVMASPTVRPSVLAPVIKAAPSTISATPLLAAKPTFAPQVIPNFGVPAKITTRMAPPPPAPIANTASPAVQTPVAVPISSFIPIASNIKNPVPNNAAPAKTVFQPSRTIGSPAPIMMPTPPVTTLVSGPPQTATAPVPMLSNGVVNRAIATSPIRGSGGPSAMGPSAEQLAAYAKRQPAQHDLAALPSDLPIAEAFKTGSDEPPSAA